MVTQQSAGARYNFNADFEQDVVKLVCGKPTFWDRIGKHVDPAALGDPIHQIIVTICRDVYVEVKRPPAGCKSVILQRVNELFVNKKIDVSQLENCEDFIEDAALTVSEIDEDAIVNELAKKIRRFKSTDFADRISDKLYKKEEIANEEVVAELKQLGRIGKQRGVETVRLNDTLVDYVSEEAPHSTIPSGINELDAAIRGGLPRNELSAVCAATGVGKSLTLTGIAQACLIDGLNIRYASLADLSAAQVWARIISGLVEIPSNDINKDYLANEADKRWKVLCNEGFIKGNCGVARFDSQGTTFEDIVAWVENEELATGQKVDVLLIDYIDIMSAGEEVSRREKRHMVIHMIASSMKDYADAKKKTIVTATQATRGDKNRKSRIVSTDDSAESLGLPKFATVFFSLNPREEGRVAIYLSKSRFGENDKTWEMPLDGAYGRVVAPNRDRSAWPFKNKQAADLKAELSKDHLEALATGEFDDDDAI